MSKQYLVEITMTGEQWIEAENEEEAIEKAEADPFGVLQYTGNVVFSDLLDVKEEAKY